MKKGAFPTVVFLILAVIGAIILFAGTTLWAGQTEKGFDKDICRASVTMVALSKKVSIIGSPWLDLKCSTQKRRLNPNDREEIMETLVKDIKDCWYQYGSGKIDFTSNWDWASPDDYCFVCSVINFDKKGEPITIDEFRSYTLKNLELDTNLRDDISQNLKIEPNNPIFVIFGITKEKGISGESFWERLPQAAKFVLTLGAYKSGHIPSLVVANINDIGDNRCDGWYKDSKMILKKRG